MNFKFNSKSLINKLVVNFWTMHKFRDIASARPVARPIIVRFWYFLLIIFLLFLRWRQPQVSKMLPAACHHVLEEVFAAVHWSRFSG